MSSSFLQPFMFYKGFHATAAQRIAHALWQRRDFSSRSEALALQSRTSEAFGVDIHPAADLAGGLFIDHASGVVVGETARVGPRCTMLHSVTLGASGKANSSPRRRHPVIGADVVLGAGCSVLGAVRVGDGAVVGAQAVVSKDVPAGCTVVGVNKVISAPSSSPGSVARVPRAEGGEGEGDEKGGDAGRAGSPPAQKGGAIDFAFMSGL